MADKQLKPWERADRLLQKYEMINPDPTMVYVTDENTDNVTRIIADLLHYCAHQNSRVGPEADSYTELDAILREAEALYNSEGRPHERRSEGPSK